MIASVAGRAAATSFPLLDIFWTLLWIVLFSIWVCLLIMVFYDIFRSRDLAGWAKALWTLVVIIFPLLGVLIYLIARGNGIEERRMQAAQGNRPHSVVP
jgi:Phospholipase_D-nuclease N-terminal